MSKSNVSIIVESADNALSNVGNVQKAIRDTFADGRPADDQLFDVCVAMGIFKDSAANTEVGMDKSEIPDFRKRVNNIINDVSRISREVTGKSIVLASRKDGHVYQPKEPSPRKPKAEVVITGTIGSPEAVGISAAEVDSLRKTIEDQEKIIKHQKERLNTIQDHFDNQPIEVIKTLLDTHRSEVIGRLVVEEIRAREEIPF